MRAIIFAASPSITDDGYKYLNNDYLIGLEDGALRLIEKGLIPDLVICDFDTCSNPSLVKEKAKKVITLNPIKDEIDLEAALKEVIKLDIKDVVIYNGFGGRIDHSLVTIMLLYKYQDLNIVIDNGCEKAYLIKGERKIAADLRFSLIACQKQTISISGAMYNLDKVEVFPFDTYLTSNKSIKDTYIKTDGTLIIIEEKKGE